jgi:hypothetical protein
MIYVYISHLLIAQELVHVIFIRVEGKAGGRIPSYPPCCSQTACILHSILLVFAVGRKSERMCRRRGSNQLDDDLIVGVGRPKSTRMRYHKAADGAKNSLT